jgi:ATP-dependent Clp endopeptidase proteolytic subunit ClpP
VNTAWGFTLRGEGTDTLELDIYDVIGESFWSDGVTAKDVRRKLKDAKGAKLIKLRVNSGGGDVIDGFAIYNLLSQHPARVEADVDALAASMASVILMAADEIRIASNAMVMIHNPWGMEMGEADDLRRWADVLDKMRDQIADTYAARTGQPRDKLLELMAAETWLTAQEAKELGFVDKIVASKKGKAATRAMAGLDLSRFEKPPSEFASAVAQARFGAAVTSALPAPDPTADMAAQTPPGPVARVEHQPTPNGDEETTMSQPAVMNLVAIATVLGFAAEAAASADEQSIIASIKKLKTSARVGGEIEALVGVTGDAAIGAVRALKETQVQFQELGAEVSKLKVSNARRDFETARDQGLKDKKLTPAVAKMYSDRFDKAVAEGADGASVVADLQGFLAVAPRINSAAVPPANGGGDALQYNGKSWAQLEPMEKHRLKAENPELYDLMRREAEAAY